MISHLILQKEINAETSTKEQLKEIVKLIAELEKEHTCECTLNLVVH